MSYDQQLFIDLLNNVSEKIDSVQANQNEQHVEVMTAVVELQTQMKALIGNGKPGRIDKIETKVDRLWSFRGKVLGVAAFSGTVVSLIWATVLHFIPFKR